MVNLDKPKFWNNYLTNLHHNLKVTSQFSQKLQQFTLYNQINNIIDGWVSTKFWSGTISTYIFNDRFKNQDHH